MLSLSDLIHDLSDSEDEPDRSTLMARLAISDRPAIEGMGSSRLGVPLQSSAERCGTDQGQRAGQQDWGLSSVTSSPWHEEYGSFYEPASDGSNGGDGAGGEVDLLEHGHAALAGQHHEHSDHLMQLSPLEQLTPMMAYGDAYANATACGRISLPLPPTTPPPRSPRPRGPRRAEPEPRPSPLSATVIVDGPLGRLEQSTHSMSIQDAALETLNADDCHAGRDSSVDSSTAPSTPRNRKRSIDTEPSTPSDAPSPKPAVTANMSRSLSDLYDESEHDDMALQVAETGKEVESFAERMVAFVYNDTDGDGSATLAGVITPLKKRISGLFLGLSSRKGDEDAMIHQVDDQKALGKSESGTHVDKPDMPAIVAQIVPSKADPSVIVRAHASRDGAEGEAVPSEVGSELMVDDDTTMAHLEVQDIVDAERAVSASIDEGPEDDAQDVEPEECARIRDDLPAPTTSSSLTTLISSWTENTIEVHFGDPEYSDSAHALDQEASPQEAPIPFHDENKPVDLEPEQSSELPISVNEEDEEDRQQNISTPGLEATTQSDPPSSSPAPATQDETRSALELPAMKDKSNDSEAEAEVAQFAVGTLVDEVESHAEAAPDSKETAQMEHAEDPIVEDSHATIIDEVLSEAVETMRIQRESRSHKPRLDSSEDLPVFEEADAIGDEEEEVIDDEVGEGEYVTHRSPRGIDERSEMRSADLYSVPSSPLARFTSEASDDSLQRDEVSDDGSQRNEASDDGEQREDPFNPPREATPVVGAPSATSLPGLESPTPQHAPRPKPKPEPASKPTPKSASIPAQSFYVDVPALPRRRHSSTSEHAGSSRSSRQIESRRPLGPTDKSLESPIASIRAKNEARLFDDPPDLDEPGSREASVQSRSSSTRQLLGDSLAQSSPGPIPMDVELMEEHLVEAYQQIEAFGEAGFAADDVAPVPQSEQDNESDDVAEPISPPRRQPRRIIVEEGIPLSSPLPCLPPLPSSIALSGSIRLFDSLSKSPPPVEHDQAPPSPGPSTRRQDGDSSSEGETLIMIPRARPKKKRKKASPAVKKNLPRPSIESAQEVSDGSSADELDMLRTAKVRLSPIIGRKITLQSRHITTPTTTEPYHPKTVTKTRNANPSNHRLSLPSRSVPALDRSNAKGYIIVPSRPHASSDNAPPSNGRPARTRKSTANWWELSKGLQRNEPLKTKRQRKNDDDYEPRGLDEGLEDDEVVRSSVTKRKSPSSLSKRRRVSRVVDDDEED
ncbi:hypothetical protein MVLG_06431 [Microbotryum lychnidis-dioicae p1A1 Lamole]|uniref:Uncharacterized protein n=1 Tax=Microbotryum lychnidis-dioicae (strain p1A1 Lamole / MvSl-1064) TaxID=683840 RepID=U5HH94_USTV1|nr:hypothetical protein MVLG_06431 [Microbotryum lychnidis-dioicae p1A1 Lamole]|eukprot:KDE03041.1 hypothetical protein MVLG_06431 [Microbotryum lychnidis-dioicae p1A1 Lamole]